MKHLYPLIPQSLVPQMKSGICAVIFVVTTIVAGFATQPVRAADDIGSLHDLLPPQSSPLVRRTHAGRVDLFNSVLNYRMPLWATFEDGAAPGEKSKFQRSSGKGVFRLDITPHDDDFKNWTNLYSIIAFKHRNIEIEKQARQLINSFKAVCSPNNMKTYPGGRSPNKLAVVIACGNYSRNRGSGQVAAIMLLKRGELGVTIMRQWRSKSFITGVASQWPVTKDELNITLKELGRSRLLAKRQKQPKPTKP